MNGNSILCPKCGSDQLSANKKGFSGKKAVVGAVLTGGLGLLAGTIGSNKIIITCLNCGNQFKPGEKPTPEWKATSAQPKIIWDDVNKKHVLNPNYNNVDDSTTIAKLVLGIIFVVIIFGIIKCMS